MLTKDGAAAREPPLRTRARTPGCARCASSKAFGDGRPRASAAWCSVLDVSVYLEMLPLKITSDNYFVIPSPCF